MGSCSLRLSLNSNHSESDGRVAASGFGEVTTGAGAADVSAHDDGCDWTKVMPMRIGTDRINQEAFTFSARGNQRDS